MEFERLLEIIGDEPVFESALLLAGNINPASVRLQLSRWTKSGRIYQLRRGLYAIAPPYRKIHPHPFLVANRLQRASYVSLQSALSFYGLIPEVLHGTTSVTAGRPQRLTTPLGEFEFRRIQRRLVRSYRMTDLGGQQALLALPEKALLDLVYLQPNGDDPVYLHELRLQNLERLDLGVLQKLAEAFGTPKLERAVKVISGLITEDAVKYELV